MAIEKFGTLPDGRTRYPGNLEVEATFTLDNPALDVLYRAKTYRATPCNLAHLSNWALDASGTILDRNFCLSHARQALRPAVWPESPASGISLTIKTTEPGLQVYESGPMSVPILAIDERALTHHSCVALEPQAWPDAINNSDFAQAALRPGESYDQHTRFEIERK